MNAISQPPVFAPAAVRNAVEIENVTKYFGKLKVLEDVSLTAQAGSVLAVVGASGCGKSTLLNIIAGLVTADQGAVRLMAPRAPPSRTHASSAICFRRTACCLGDPFSRTSSLGSKRER